MNETLARRAVACRKWSWQPGMLAQTAASEVPDLRYLDGGCWWDIECEEVRLSEPDDPLPDLTDPATIGCLLALVREVWPDATTQIDSGKWWIADRVGNNIGRFPTQITEPAALVAALEAAPC